MSIASPLCQTSLEVDTFLDQVIDPTLAFRLLKDEALAFALLILQMNTTSILDRLAKSIHLFCILLEREVLHVLDINFFKQGLMIYYWERGSNQI